MAVNGRARKGLAPRSIHCAYAEWSPRCQGAALPSVDIRWHHNERNAEQIWTARAGNLKPLCIACCSSLLRCIAAARASTNKAPANVAHSDLRWEAQRITSPKAPKCQKRHLHKQMLCANKSNSVQECITLSTCATGRYWNRGQQTSRQQTSQPPPLLRNGKFVLEWKSCRKPRLVSEVRKARVHFFQGYPCTTNVATRPRLTPSLLCAQQLAGHWIFGSMRSKARHIQGEIVYTVLQASWTMLRILANVYFVQVRRSV